MDPSPALVLLVQDALERSRGYSEALEDARIEVRCASREGAVEAAAAWRPDLVLLDAGSNRMEGVAAFEALRRDRRTAGLPVVILSGSTKRRVIESLRTRGADDYWTLHDLEPDVLVRQVRAWLATHPRRLRSRAALAS